MPENHPNQPETASEPLTASQSEAEVVKQTSASAALATCLSKTLGKVISSDGFKAYHDDILTACGRPKDPIEKMMVEQLLLAHHRIGDLHAQSACANDAEVVAVFNVAALRLMAEFRKTSLALREYRTPVAAPNVTVVRQQNVAAGDQQIAYVDDNTVEPPEKSDARSELGSNEPKAITHEQPINIIPQSTASGSRSAEPVEAGRIDSSRTQVVAGVGTEQSALDPVNWPENGER